MRYAAFKFNLIGKRMSAPASSVQLDSVHCRAICEEIGYRLGEGLRGKIPEVPPRLEGLLEQLRLQDLQLAPSLAPSLEDLAPLEAPVSA